MKHPFIPFSVAMVTPFSSKGELDFEGISSLIDYYKKQEVPALLISGSTGEQHSMTIQERCDFFSAVKQEAKQDLLLYGGVAAVQTKDAVTLARAADKAELDAIMLGFPPYVRISQQEAFHYVKAICAATSLPIMLYNNPPRTGFHLETNTVFKLVEAFPQIKALKEAGDPTTVKTVKKQLGEDFMILSGTDLALIENAEFGYDGITSIIGNIFPKEVQPIITALQKKDKAEATKLFTPIKQAASDIIDLGALRTIKYLLTLKGVHAGICREPLSTLNAEEKELAAANLQKITT
ncbi:dihydrodipicolinate synthase family protein [Niallia sp. 01092]|uniref:dihydrodipicolinate synthase family protein n=1 Tax=unclassified Niallia TaxID=2837522 RepID=UPI003FD549ED